MTFNKTIGTVAAVGIMLIIIMFAAKWIFFPAGSIDKEKTITSTGSSEILAMPDQAEIYMRIEVLRQTTAEAASESKEKSDAVLKTLEEFKGAKAETTSYNIYKKEDWSEKGPVFKGYAATYSLKVTTKNFDETGKIIDQAVSKGVNLVDNVQFTLSKDEEERIRKDALKKAGENARQKAEAVAEGLGFKLGDIVSVSESNFYYPPIVFGKAVEAVEAGEKVADLKIQPMDITVSASVNVVYGIKQ